jgi:hypothetical protein
MDVRTISQCVEHGRAADRATGHVIAYMGNPGRTLLEGQEGVEACYSVCLGGGNAKAFAHVVEGALAYPPDLALYGM